MAGRTYQEFADAAATREETLTLVVGLDQEPSEHRLREGLWSVGEVLDHLLKLDTVMIRELEIALERGGRQLPFVYRSIADIDRDIVPAALRPFLPLFEVPFSLINAVVPQPLRRALTGNRRMTFPAPGVLQPQHGRPIEQLRNELRATFVTLERQQAERPDLDLNRVYYYNPITGLNCIPGMYRFTANHEKRHQAQLREILADLTLNTPTATEIV